MTTILGYAFLWTVTALFVLFLVLLAFGDDLTPCFKPTCRPSLADMSTCLKGPMIWCPWWTGCSLLDYNGDNHVDLLDAVIWQVAWVSDIPVFFWMCNTWQLGQPGATEQRLQWFRLWGHTVLDGPGIDIEAPFAQRLYDFDFDNDVDLADFAALQRTANSGDEIR